MYYTCNPGNVGHAWVKRLFIDRQYQQGENAEDYNFIPAKIYDNRILMNADPNYVKQLLALPEDLRRAHLDGDWDVHAGQYFREFSREKHVVAPFEIPHWWRRFRSMDWGYNDPCCVLWHAADGEGRVFTYRELYVRQTLAGDVARRAVELSPRRKHCLHRCITRYVAKARRRCFPQTAGLKAKRLQSFLQPPECRSRLRTIQGSRAGTASANTLRRGSKRKKTANNPCGNASAPAKT